MQVVLKVVGGKNDGREIPISVSEFIIGRGEEAHLRPSSDLVSRQHTAIKIADGKVIIEDLNSRNGTFINGEKITEAYIAKVGDTLRVGRLQFEVVIDHVKPGAKKPKVQDVVEAAARTASAASTRKPSIEDSITNWLIDDDDVDDSESTIKNAETIQLNLEETLALSQEELGPGKKADKGMDDSTENSDDLTVLETTGKNKKKKSKPGKLPPVPKMSHGSSTNAADDVLRKFFNRR